MKVILLAGGQSKRVKPIEDKCFVRVCGRYLIEHQLEALGKAGFDDVVIVGNANNLERLGELAVGGVQIVVVEQVDLDGGMMAAMQAAKTEVIDEEAVFVVSSNDIVEDQLWQDVRTVLDERTGDDGFMVGYKVQRYFPGGYLQLNDDGYCQSLAEKPGEGNEPSDLVNLVIHLHKDVKGLYAALEAASSEHDDVYEVALQQLFDEQKKYSIVEYDGFWQAVKYPWHFLRLNEFFLGKLERSISSEAQISETAVIQGDVVIEAGVRVFEYAVIKGPAYLSTGTIVGDHAKLRESSVGAGSIVGGSAEVTRSLLGDKVETHDNFVGDSVLSDETWFGAGTITANFRLDKKNLQLEIRGQKVDTHRDKIGVITGERVKVGINCSTMPGVRIGSDSILDAGLRVNQDIPKKSYVKNGQILDVRKNKVWGLFFIRTTLYAMCVMLFR
ncbi:MAG: NTP transferase domain-containing protein [Candidatus Gracilibacteria bacterium]|nr:NTP transferase domain-containing protein [Candidatus Gracilibacteria bacterium]